MGVILFGFILVIVVAVVFSLPVLIPPLRRRLRENQLWRRVSIGVLSGLTLIFMFWFMVYFPNYIGVYFYLLPIDGTLGMNQPEPPTELIQSVTNELWLRRITPPVIRKYCMTGNADVCAIADKLEARDIALNSNQDWGSYLGMWLMILAPAVVTGFFVHRFTRANRKQKQKLE
jgi:ABC-type dipeptide/oligopeptide/nickel transport system permease component